MNPLGCYCCYLLIFLIAHNNKVYGQTLNDKNQIIEQRITMLLDRGGDEFQFDEQLYERLEHYTNYPLNINLATKPVLKELALLNDHQINSLIKHINTYGELISIFELQAVKGFNLSIIELIRPFITVKSTEKISVQTVKKLINGGNHHLFLRYSRNLNKKVGYDEKRTLSKYEGTADKYYARYRFSASDKIRWGITTEKDAGEEFFKGSQPKGFDYYSGHIMVSNIGNMQKLLIGDYDLKFGQGVTLWSGYSYNNSESIIDQKRNNLGIVPHISVEENDFLRGLASTIKFGKVDVTGFYSRNAIDARIRGQNFGTFSTSGLHRTVSEIAAKNGVQETIMGLRSDYLSRNIGFGVTLASIHYDHVYIPEDRLYKKYAFEGKRLLKLGTDYDFFVGNANFYGEFSFSEKEISFINGCHLLLTPALSVLASVRNYSRSFISLKTNMESRWSSSNGETGIYYGLEYKPSKGITLSAYSELYKNNWLKYNVSGLGNGHQHYLGGHYRFHKTTKISLYYIHRSKPENRDQGATSSIFNSQNQHLRFSISHYLSKNWLSSSRIEYHFYRKGLKEKGSLFYQEISYHPVFKKYSFSIRYALFDTKTFNSRIYAYERDVLYAYQFPVYFNKGSRFYVLLKYKFSSEITCWVRYSSWLYPDQSTIGAGLEKINGNLKNEIKIQVSIKF